MPVVIISDENKYVDVLNSPSGLHIFSNKYSHFLSRFKKNNNLDTSNCLENDCKRIATYFAFIEHNKSYNIFFADATPNQLRFRILNSDCRFKVRLSVFYFASRRIDLYRNNLFVNATNVEYNNGKMQFKEIGNNSDSFIPKCTSESGQNIFLNNKEYFTLSGTDLIDLKIAPVLSVKVDVENLANDSSIDKDKIFQIFPKLLDIDFSQLGNIASTIYLVVV